MLKVRTTEEKYVVEYKDDKKVLAKFFVKPIPMSKTRKMLDDNKIVEWDSPPGDEQPKERFIDHNYLAITLDRIDGIICDWEGVVDKDGEELECTRENKLAIFEYDPSVINYVLEEARKIFEVRESEKARAEKNLKTGRIGKRVKR